MIEFEIPETENDRHYASRPYATGGRYGGRSNASREPFSGDRGGSAFETHPAGAPPLDYWEIPTQGYTGSHYATWPEKLCVRPILSMCPTFVCRTCGEPRRRITEAEPSPVSVEARRSDPERYATRRVTGSHEGVVRRARALGWTDCGHDNYRRGIVLDPFAGSGTTLAVAHGHGRDAIGIDLDARNAELAQDRVGGLFLTVLSASPAGTNPNGSTPGAAGPAVRGPTQPRAL